MFLKIFNIPASYSPAFPTRCFAARCCTAPTCSTTSRSGVRFGRPTASDHRGCPIGGIEQWIEVRGHDAANPILLFIHGGPGVSFIPLAGSFQDPWEKQFTVVQWEQRRAGKTYASNDKELQRRTMNIPQMEQDALDVANYLRARFHRD